MLFQNSCVVPFGMTAIVSFFFVAGDGPLVQLTSRHTSSTKRNLRIIRFSLKNSFNRIPQPRGFLARPYLRSGLPSHRPASETPAGCVRSQHPEAYPSRL